MKTNIKWILLAIALFIVLFTAVQLLRQPVMTEAEMDARIEEIYGGVVRNSVRDGDEVTIAFTREKSMYEVTMDARTGTFSELEIIFEEPSETSTNQEPTGQTTTSGQPTEQSDQGDAADAQLPARRTARHGHRGC